MIWIGAWVKNRGRKPKWERNVFLAGFVCFSLLLANVAKCSNKKKMIDEHRRKGREWERERWIEIEKIIIIIIYPTDNNDMLSLEKVIHK